MITPPWPSATLSPKQQGHVQRSLRVPVPETPVRDRLYADIRKRWLVSGRADFQIFGDLLSLLLFHADEVSPEDDEQIRAAYDLGGRA